MALDAELKQYIDGRWTTGGSHTADEIFEPVSGQVMAEMAAASREDVDRAVGAAERAFGDWARTTPGERSAAVLRLADALESDAENLAQLESRNVGKPISLAREEMGMIPDHLRFFAGAARSLEGRAAGEYVRGKLSYIRREPIGVVGSVAPWNYPLLMAIWKIAPALLTGNTLVLKPSEHTPLTALRLAQLAEGIFPTGVLNVVTGTGEDVGAQLVSHPRVRMTSLTGSVETGKALMQLSGASNLKRLHLELGGKAPVLVFADADLDLVVRKVMEGAYGNSGQDCMAASRLYAHSAIHDELVAKLEAAVKGLALGDLADEATQMGPVITRQHQERVLGFVSRAADLSHTEILQGDAPDGGFYVRPTLIVGAKQSDEVVQNEIFGPVVSVTRFTDDDDVVRWANDTEYGLAASVFTGSISRAHTLCGLLQFGTVWINDHLPITPEMPHGGFKQSGQGKDMSVYSLEEYTVVKHVMVNTEES